MNVLKIVNGLKKDYPGKNIIRNGKPVTEIICEIDPTGRHPDFSRAIAVVDKIAPHYHLKTADIYKILKGTLILYKNGKKNTVKKGKAITIKPGTIHWAKGKQTRLEVISSPGWTVEDHILIKIIQNTDKAIAVIYKAGQWLENADKHPSKWWQPKNLNKVFLLKYAKSNEFYVATAGNNPVAAAVFQVNQHAQDWGYIDKKKSQSALYIHWLCVDRRFAGMGLPKIMVDFAKQYARSKGIDLLRVDTNGQKLRLRKIYENLGFRLIGVRQEDYRETAFYQQEIGPATDFL
ncbi:GNAT family N-acetyltransferase [Candidatus Roizmanbacteria bacterium]|nr:GNAT family N-acetyltransferase [Candidatus Roizmanbacteria bacterium]